jgi:hypothetical protein
VGEGRQRVGWLLRTQCAISADTREFGDGSRLKVWQHDGCGGSFASLCNPGPVSPLQLPPWPHGYSTGHRTRHGIRTARALKRNEAMHVAHTHRTSTRPPVSPQRLPSQSASAAATPAPLPPPPPKTHTHAHTHPRFPTHAQLMLQQRRHMRTSATTTSTTKSRGGQWWRLCRCHSCRPLTPTTHQPRTLLSARTDRSSRLPAVRRCNTQTHAHARAHAHAHAHAHAQGVAQKLWRQHTITAAAAQAALPSSF